MTDEARPEAQAELERALRDATLAATARPAPQAAPPEAAPPPVVEPPVVEPATVGPPTGETPAADAPLAGSMASTTSPVVRRALRGSPRGRRATLPVASPRLVAASHDAVFVAVEREG